MTATKVLSAPFIPFIIISHWLRWLGGHSLYYDCEYDYSSNYLLLWLLCLGKV